MSEVLIVLGIILVCIILMFPVIYTACNSGQVQCLLQMAPLLI